MWLKYLLARANLLVDCVITTLVVRENQASINIIINLVQHAMLNQIVTLFEKGCNMELLNMLELQLSCSLLKLLNGHHMVRGWVHNSCTTPICRGRIKVNQDNNISV